MEQAKCLNICMKTKNTSMKRCTHQSSSSSSWEYYQEATTLSHDSNRDSLGGLPMWPPRSYSCSFCKREFRSAQALGGHMNVHRRDRALLKEMITTTHDHHDHDLDHDHVHQGINPSKSTIPQYPSQVCVPRTSSVTQHHSLTRVSPNYHSINENRKVISNANDDLFQANNKLSMGLNLAIGTYKKEEHDQEESFKCKRSKKIINGDYDVNALFPPFFEDVKRSNYLESGDLIRVPEILSIKANNKSMEELDLELRLGYPPHKVKLQTSV